MSRKIIALLICVVVLCAGVLGGCANTSSNAPQAGQGGQAAEGKKILGIIQHSGSDTFQQMMTKGAQDAGERLGYQILTGVFNGDAAKQQELIRNFAQQGATGIILGATSAETADAGTEQAHELGMMVVTLDQTPGQSSPESCVIGDDVTAGYLAAKALAEEIGGKGKVAIGTFPSPITPSVKRSEGFKLAFAEYPDIEIVSETSSGFDAIKAMNWAAALIQAHPDIKGFCTIENTSAIGVIRAVENAKLEGQTKVAVVGESQEMFDELRNGNVVVGITAMHSYSFGALAVDILDGFGNGKPMSSQIMSTGILVTKDNIDHEEEYLKLIK